MPDHFQHIYHNHAARYDRMVAREDYQGSILKALNDIRLMSGAEVVEFGAGTGRLTRLLAPQVKSIRAYDAAQAMLNVAAQSLTALGVTNWQVAVGDNRKLPAADASADVTIEGWSFGHFAGWYPDTWREEVDAALAEMRRILRPGGVAILLETLGTGFETPTPPSEHLAALYQWWQQEQGFAHRWIRTDYQFESVAEAAALTGFFFGDELADRITREQLTILPECTGLWWKVLA